MSGLVGKKDLFAVLNVKLHIGIKKGKMPQIGEIKSDIELLEHKRSMSCVYSKRYFARNREIILKRNKEYWEKNKEKFAKIKLNYRQGLKREVLTHYGNGKCACIICGFIDIKALTIDHINGGGHKHLREAKINSLYNWLKSNNYPEGYQTLCMNCQFIKKLTEDKGI